MHRNYFPNRQINQRSSSSNWGNSGINNLLTKVQNPFQKYKPFKPNISNISSYRIDTKYHNSVNCSNNSYVYQPKHRIQCQRSVYPHQNAPIEENYPSLPMNRKQSPFKDSNFHRNSSSSSPFQVNNSVSSYSKSSPYQKVYAFQARNKQKFSTEKFMNRSYQKKFRPKVYSQFQSQKDSNLKWVLANSPFHQLGFVQSSQISNNRLNQNRNESNQIKNLNNPFVKKHLMSSSKQRQNVNLKTDYDCNYSHHDNTNFIYKPFQNQDYSSGHINQINCNGYTSNMKYLQGKGCKVQTISDGTQIQRLQFLNQYNQQRNNRQNKQLAKGRSMTQRNSAKNENTNHLLFQSSSFKLSSHFHPESQFKTQDENFNREIQNDSSYQMKFGSYKRQIHGSSCENIINGRINQFKAKQTMFQQKQNACYNETGKFPQIVNFQNKQYRLTQQL